MLVVVAGGLAAPPQGHGKRDRAAVIAYWTPERVARAVPREVSPDRLRSFAKPRETGKAPGGPSRWSTERSAEWEPLRPELVVEVGYDHVSGGRFRHGTRFLRWRPDKAPKQCRMDQLAG